MSITTNKRISKEKEVFMAICLLSGIISNQTVRRMKKDWGDNKVKNGIIQTLKSDGYLTKIGSLTFDYGYQLTPEGLEYMKVKFPNKYNYSLYAESTAYKYKETTKERGYQSSMVLYTLYKMGVSLTDHNSEASNIFNGYEQEIAKPFFLTSKEVKSLNIRFRSLYGDRAYGFIFSTNKIIAVYAPDKEHNLLVSRERRLISAITNVLKYAKPPYDNPQSYEVLYLYNSFDDIVDSFSMVNKINKRQAATRRVYDDFKFKHSHICLMENNPYSIWDILDEGYKDEVDDVFWEYYNLEEHHINKVNAIYVKAKRITSENKRRPTVICWDLSPSAIVSTIAYCIERYGEADKKGHKAGETELDGEISDEKILFLCFKEQAHVLEEIIKLNKISFKHIIVGSLSSTSVYDYLEGKIDHIS